MKKIYCSVFIILIIPLIFSLKVFAYDGLSVVQDFATQNNVTVPDEFYQNLNTYWSIHPNNKCLIMVDGSGYTGLYSWCAQNVYFDTNAYVNYNTPCQFVGYSSGFSYNLSVSNLEEGPYNFQYYNNKYILIDSYNDADLSINFDTLYYSPLIPTPILNQYYTAYNESGINIPYVPLTFDLSNSSDDYYLQIKQKNYTPSVVRVDGANKFNVQARNGIGVHDVYEMADLIVSSDFSRSDFYNDISGNWTADLNEFEFSNVEMINGLQSTIGSTADAYFLAQTSKFQQLRNIQTVYGNIIEIWARYFIVDENNNVVVGKWYHWWSLASDSFDEQLPEYVIPYEKAYGTENTTDNNNAPDQVGTTNSTGTSSNPNQNYTYVSVVPNYPDYPTIASYNKDNLLVDTITKMLEVKHFFGEFNEFLTVSFVWVPDWIWGLIGIGFGLSILVFFLRML